MKRRVPIFATALILGALATAAVPPRLGVGADGSPNMTGTWTGKKSYKDWDLNGGATNAKGSCPMTLVLTQDGASLSGTFTIQCPEDPPKPFTVDGKVGANHFWLEGSYGGPVAEGILAPTLRLSGQCTGASLKAAGYVLYGPDFVSEIKVSGRRP